MAIPIGKFGAERYEINCHPTRFGEKFTISRYAPENSGFDGIATKRAPDFVMGIGSEYAG